MGSIRDYDASFAESRSVLAAPEMSALVRYATLAPNGHNTQPWQFRIRPEGVDILPDFARRTPVVDPDDHQLFVSLGCAAESLAITAAAHGRPGGCRFDPAKDGSVAFTFGPGQAEVPGLFDVFARRQSTRADYDGRQVNAVDLERLVAASAARHLYRRNHRSAADGARSRPRGRWQQHAIRQSRVDARTPVMAAVQPI